MMYSYNDSLSCLRDQLHSIIKNFKIAFPDNFDMCGLTICSKCNGTGIPVQGQAPGITHWQPGTYCSKCHGIGFHGIGRVYDKYLCTCNKPGCKKCNDKGFVDWISNVMGSK